MWFPTGTEKNSGTCEDLGKGIIYAKDANGNKVADAVLHRSYAANADEHVLIIDICDTNNNFFILPSKPHIIHNTSHR